MEHRREQKNKRFAKVHGPLTRTDWAKQKREARKAKKS